METDVKPSAMNIIGWLLYGIFRVTDGSIEPLKAKLSELEQAVADQLESIAAVKHSIIENDEKITKMLSSVTRT